MLRAALHLIHNHVSSLPPKLLAHPCDVARLQPAYREVPTADGLPTLLLLHGAPGTALDFKSLLRNTPLRQQFKLLAVDRPGYGGSAALGLQTSLAKQAHCVAKMLQPTPMPLLVIGHSYGAPVALQLALLYPALVQGLILVGASADPALEPIKAVQRLANHPWVRWWVPAWLNIGNQELLALPAQLALLKQQLHLLTLPITIIHGGKDTLSPPGNVAYLVKHLGNARVLVMQYPRLDHFIPYTHPEIITQAAQELYVSIATP